MEDNNVFIKSNEAQSSLDLNIKKNNAANSSILLIGVEKSNLSCLEALLSKDYSISIAKTAAAGIEKAIKDKPDIILLNIIKSCTDGFEMLSTLKKISETENIPVIIVSTFTDIESEEKGLILGAVDYVKIPFNDRILKARINTHIQILKQLHVIEQRGIMDGLTNIPNRRCFDERIALEWRRAMRDQRNLSFLMIDIDKFKDYNDTYGHLHGDSVLKAVAQILVAAVMRSTDMCARIGGEEFAVIMPDTNLSGAIYIAEKIRTDVEALRLPSPDGKIITTVTVSIGIASLIPKEKDTIVDFMSKADANLYTAKKAGRNKVFY